MLQGKTALITGSSQGIGLAVARAYLDAGARVVLTSEKPRAAMNELDAALALPGAHYIQADLAIEGEPARLMDQAWGLLGGIDVLVNNVGIFREPPLSRLARDDFDAVFRLNVWAGIELTRELVRRAETARRSGRIIFTSSLNATRSEPRHTLYDASKGAVNALTRQLAVELAPLGFTVVAVAPGLVETPMTDFGLRGDFAARQTVIDQIPLRRIATVEDIAAWYVFLASERSHYATGAIIALDGGLDAQQMAHRPMSAREFNAPS